jgi:hypothetical protein
MGNRCLRVTLLLLFSPVVTRTDRDSWAHEAVAIKAIQTMQVQYNSQYGRFATSLTELGPPASGAVNASSADFIDSGLAAGERAAINFR